MAEFHSDLRDLKFVLFEQLALDPLLTNDRFSHLSREDLAMILEEAYRFAKEVIGPTNMEGDRTGCVLRDGKVSVPKAFHNAYRQSCEAGWAAINCSQEWGGQGAPDIMRTALDDMFFGANIGLNLGMLLTPGAAHLIETFGSAELKNAYLKKMYGGQWGGTMCLTEPHAGSDVGASTTRARKEGDHYLIEGEKIFISFGEHDLTENIIHCVLARTENSQKGTKGLSLFVVPKYRLKADGTMGEFNDVVCTNIEHKMGIHGSPTCAMHFGPNGRCEGWLLGEEQMGMRMMFQLMNEARIGVGMQGSALANAAYQAALRYAQDRLQGPDVTNFKDPEAPRVPIIRHPDVRMMLLRQKAYAEGMRAMLLFASYCADRAKVERRKYDRETYQGLLEFLTPICKAYCSDMGFRVTEWALQTYGGYGYLKDYPAEQYLRDCKIASIYEGTNGIQAMDLIARKLPGNGGANVMAVAGLLSQFIDKHNGHAHLGPQVQALGRARDAWGKVNAFFMQLGAQRQLLVPLLNASGYLSLCGDLLLGYFLCEQALIADDKLTQICNEAGVDRTDKKAVANLATYNPDARYYDGKIKTAKFYCSYELPQIQAKAESIMSQDTSAYDIKWDTEVK